MRKLHTMLEFGGANLFPAMTTVKPNDHGFPLCNIRWGFKSIPFQTPCLLLRVLFRQLLKYHGIPKFT